MGKEQLSDSRFGKWGWSMVIYSALLYFFNTGTATDGLNIYTGAFKSTYGLDPNTLLACATPAGIIGVIGAIVGGRLILKIGARRLSLIMLVISGTAFGLFGFLGRTTLSFLVLMSLFTFTTAICGLIVTTSLMNNWFPRKKGIALGWATMGAPLSSMAFVPLLSGLASTFGIGIACAVIGVLIVVLGLLTPIWVRDYPEEVGAYPDNIKNEKIDVSSQLGELQRYKSPFTIGRLLKDKDMWLIACGFGFLWIVTGGLMSQFVPRMVSVGFEQSQGILMLSVSAVFGVVGSYFWGWVDQKTNTKLASVVYALCYIVALLLLIQGSKAAAYASVVFIGFGVGGLLNLMPSLVISVYGRYDFGSANGLVTPIASLLQKFTFIIMAALLQVSQGSFLLPYAVFIGIDVVGAVFLMLVTNKCKGKVD
jgi:MFS family permease